MYVPRHFRVDDPAELAAFMRANPFASFVTIHDGSPFVTHIPFLIEGEGPDLTLAAHIARANPQWRDMSGPEALVTFTGPHAYVSPRWYGLPNVPTWNYAAVHVYGHARIIEERDEKYDLVRRLTDREEANARDPWRLETLAERDVDAMLEAIVAFTVMPTRIEGKYKLSQNAGREDRASVAEALDASPSEASRAVAALMRAQQRCV